MERLTALENIKKLLLKTSTLNEEEAEALKEETVLMPNLIDSLDSVELVMEIEKKLSCTIPDKEFGAVYDKGGKVCHVVDLYVKYANKTKV